MQELEDELDTDFELSLIANGFFPLFALLTSSDAGVFGGDAGVPVAAKQNGL